MTIDRYTRGVLTVIAIALVYISAMLSGRPVSAQSGATIIAPQPLVDTKPQPVVIVGWGTVRADGRIVVTTVKERDGTVHSDSTLPVRVNAMPEQAVNVSLGVTADHPLPVGLTAVTAGSAWEPIRTKVEPEPTRPKPGGGQ